MHESTDPENGEGQQRREDQPRTRVDRTMGLAGTQRPCAEPARGGAQQHRADDLPERLPEGRPHRERACHGNRHQNERERQAIIGARLQRQDLAQPPG